MEGLAELLLIGHGQRKVGAPGVHGEPFKYSVELKN